MHHWMEVKEETQTSALGMENEYLREKWSHSCPAGVPSDSATVDRRSAGVSSDSATAVRRRSSSTALALRARAAASIC
jgi:hypothetical protein